MTPFPSPQIQTRELPTETSSETPTESVQSLSTPFCALRRSASYHAEIASAVAIIFDTLPPSIRSPDDQYDHIATSDDDRINMIESDHLIVDLHPLFERVFLVEHRPRTVDGDETSLRHGSFIQPNISSHQWRLSGTHVTCDGEITIYRAENNTRSLSIFIAAPTEWSTEGLQFAIAQ